MGRDARLNEAARAQTIEIIRSDIGEMLDFGAHLTGCPSCGGLSRKPEYHVGTSLSMERSDCKMPGRHVHWECACGRMWITRSKDDPDNAAPVETGVEKLHNVLRAIASNFPEGVRVTRDQIRLSAGASIFIDDEDGDLIVRSYPAP